jgi:hypothetical protein
LTSGSFGTPTNVSRDATRAYRGSYSLRRSLPVTSGSDVNSSLYFGFYAGAPWMPVPGISVDRLFTRFCFYLDAPFSGTLKLNIYQAPGFGEQFGGVYLAEGFLGFWMAEWVHGGSAGIARIAPVSSLINAWHCIEVDYWRNGDPSGQPSAAIWLDGNQVTTGIGAPPPPGRWSGGRLYAGRRDLTSRIGTANFMTVLNGVPNNRVPTTLWLDHIAISSRGRTGM